MSEENIENKNEQENSAPETTKTSEKDKKKGKGKLVITLILIVIALAFLYKFGVLTFNGNGEGGEAAMGDSNMIVATVIGTTITRADLDEKIEQVRMSLPEGAIDPTDDASFELQLLEDLIDLELLTSAAMEKNYTVSDDEIDAEIAIIIEQFPSEEEFYNQLRLVGVSEEELRENILVEMHIRQLLNEETDIDEVSVTDEEIAALYEMSVGENTEGVPALVEVSDVIRAQITNQKSAQIIEEYVLGLRENAEIEISL